MITLPVIGAFMEAIGTIFEKKTLKKRSLNYKNYTVFSFLAIVLVFLPFLGFIWQIKPEAYQLKNILIFAFVIIVALIANLLIFYSLKRENITEFEPAWVLQPLFTVVLALIFYQTERNLVIVGLALVASLTLVAAHIRKHHLVFDKYNIAAVLGSFCFAVELVASKPILNYYSPFLFYFIRCVFILIITYAIYRPKLKEADGKSWLYIFGIGAMWVLYRAIIYYGYESVGIVYTTILFILSPVLMFIFAVVFLKEKPTMRQTISTIIILICVVAAIILSKQGL